MPDPDSIGHDRGMSTLSRTRIERIVAVVLTLAAALFLIAGFVRPGNAQHGTAAPPTFRIGAITVTAPWTRATPDGAKVAGGYLTVTNSGSESDFLTGGSFPLAGRFEMHEMSMAGGTMTMREVAGGIEIKPGATVELKPGGYHLMFMDLREKVATGQPIKGTLVFRRAGTLEVSFAVAPIGARAAPAH